MKQLQIKNKQTKGSKFNLILFLDNEGYEVHRIVRSFDENAEHGWDSKWNHKDAYLENNRVYVTKYNTKEERKVSYPIKKTNKYHTQYKGIK
jgi:ribosomal protein S6